MKNCICCGKPVWNREPIHTFPCITRHARHAKGINASRCQQFSQRKEENGLHSSKSNGKHHDARA